MPALEVLVAVLSVEEAAEMVVVVVVAEVARLVEGHVIIRVWYEGYGSWMFSTSSPDESIRGFQ